MMPIVLALLTVAMIYLATARILANRIYGALAAAAFIATPILWTQFLNDSPSLLPLLAVSAWLLAITYIDASRGLLWVGVAGAALGAGVYMTPAAAVMMPIYALLTIAVFAHHGLSRRALAVFTAVCALTAVPFVWILFGPQDEFRQTVNALRLYDAGRFNILQGIKEMVSWVGLTARSEVYYNYFNPAFLFLSGQVLFPPLVVLIPIGLYALLDESAPAPRLVLAGFVVAPAAAALLAEQPIPRRIVFLTPFAAIAAVYGVRKLASWVKRLTGSARTSRRSAAESPQ